MNLKPSPRSLSNGSLRQRSLLPRARGDLSRGRLGVLPAPLIAPEARLQGPARAPHRSLGPRFYPPSAHLASFSTLCAQHTRLHSPSTLAEPRVRNCRNPLAALLRAS